MTTVDIAKKAAAEAAADQVSDGMLLGLGTGSTVAYLLDALAARDVSFTGLATSEETDRKARELGFEMTDPADVARLDLAIDGADELTADLTLTKGGGGALLREKVVASMAERFVVIATKDKLVTNLADSFALPLEVVPFAAAPVSRWLHDLGFIVEMRDNGAYRTDNGNVVLRARQPGGLQDPAAWDVRLGMMPGVVTTGLFVGLADLALLGLGDGGLEVVSCPDR